MQRKLGCRAHAGTLGRVIPPNKRTYQQDPANYREALREAELDEAEGADIMMVKPGLPYLDVIRLLRDNSSLPIAAYHVSGMQWQALVVVLVMLSVPAQGVARV